MQLHCKDAKESFIQAAHLHVASISTQEIAVWLQTRDLSSFTTLQINDGHSLFPAPPTQSHVCRSLFESSPNSPEKEEEGGFRLLVVQNDVRHPDELRGNSNGGHVVVVGRTPLQFVIGPFL